MVPRRSCFKRRGVSLLIVDHPGVGAALRLQNLYSGPDTEKPAGACIDYLETRKEIDATRVGIIALSLGVGLGARQRILESEQDSHQ